MSAEHEAAVRRFFEELWNEGRLEVADELIAPDAVNHDPAMPEEARGPEGARQQVSMYRAAFPDTRMTILDLFSSGDRVVTRWRAEGTHEGELMGLAPTGAKVTVEGIAIDRFEGGKVVESWNHWDNLGLLQQLGAIPAAQPA